MIKDYTDGVDVLATVQDTEAPGEGSRTAYRI